MDVILHSDHNGRYGREKLRQRIVLGYLWGDEELDSPRFSYLWTSGGAEDFVDAAAFLASLGKRDLSSTQVERVLKYWERCLQWCSTQSQPPTNVFSSLSRLAVYLDSI